MERPSSKEIGIANQLKEPNDEDEQQAKYSRTLIARAI